MINTYGFIGLGDMGKPMANNLVKSQKKIYVFDAFNIEKKVPDGCYATESVDELSNNTEIIFISVPDGKASQDVVKKIILSSSENIKAIINLSTIGLAETKPILELISKSNFKYIDAPVSGGKTGAVNATITIMWSGSKEILELIKLDLKYFVKSIFYVGSTPGQGQIMKLLNNFLSAVSMTATSEAIILGLKNNLDMKTMLQVLNVSTGKNSATLDKFPNRILTETFDAAFRMSLMNKDIDLYLSEARNFNTPIDIAEVVNSYFKDGLKRFPSGDFTEIYKVIKDKH